MISTLPPTTGESLNANVIFISSAGLTTNVSDFVTSSIVAETLYVPSIKELTVNLQLSLELHAGVILLESTGVLFGSVTEISVGTLLVPVIVSVISKIRIILVIFSL